MKHINKPLGEQLKPIKIYYDDLVEIYEILKQAGDRIEIKTDEYELESIEEILSIKKPFITNLSITLYEPMVSITFTNRDIWLYAREDTPIQHGLYEKIKTLLVKKQRILAPLFYSNTLSGMFIGSSSLWWLFTDNYKYIGFIVFCIGLLWAYFGYRSQFNFYSLIVPIHEMDKPNFFNRNKDQLFIALITTIFGAIITLVFK